MEKIITRDNKQCRNCLSSEVLEIHHIEPLAKLVTDYIQTHGKLNGNDAFFYDESNGITLCRPCHKTVHKTKSEELLETLTIS
jgi:5-methylcytosine-specific restriction endonuclease McrA